MANTWNQSGTTWNTGRWGTTDPFVTGWGAKAWNDGEWGELRDETVFPTGLSITSSVGDAVAFPEQGLGRDTWNFESWGISGLTVEVTAPDAMTSNLGANGWSNASYGDNGWGMFTVNPADVMGLTGQTATGSVGSPTIIGNVTFSLTGVVTTSSVGSISLDDQIMGLTGQAITPSVGSILPADVMGLTGVSATTSLGTLSTNSNPIVDVTGVSATSSVGSISPADVMGLTGVSATFSVGSIVPADVMGLTGQTITSSVAGFGTATGFGIQAYSNVDTGSNSSYTDVATGSNTSYTDAA